MARIFPASGDELQYNAVGSGNQLQDNYAVFVALKAKPHTADQYIVYNGHGGSFGQGWGLFLQASDLELHVDFAFVANYDSGLKIPYGKWIGVVYQRKSGVSKIFANGKVSPNTSASTPFQPQDYYTIGNYANESGVGTVPWKGAIEWVTLFNTSLDEKIALELSRLTYLPHQIARLRGQLSQNHYIKPTGATVQPYIAGNILTVTGTAPAQGIYIPNYQRRRYQMSGKVVVTNNYEQTLNETVTIVDSVVKSQSRSLSEVVTVVDTVVKSQARVLNEVVTIVDSYLRTAGKGLSETVTIVDTIAKSWIHFHVLDEVVTIVDTVSKTQTRILNEVITVTDGITKSIARILNETVTIVDTISKQITKVLGEVVTIVDTFDGKLLAIKILNETITLTDNLSFVFNSLIAGVLPRVKDSIRSILDRKPTGGVLSDKPRGMTIRSKDKPEGV